jgi:type I restriction enzyme S subunit
MNITAQEEPQITQSWLGTLPNGWLTKRLKYISTINDETLPETTDPDYEILYVDIGSVDATEGIQKKEPMIFEAAPSRARRIVRDGDTIVSTVRTYLRAVAAIRNPEENLIVSTGFAVVRPKNIDSNYLAYCLRSSYFIETVVSRSVGVSYPATNPTDVSCIELPLPSVDEQQSIARFLDAKTAQIDALVAQKRQLIDKLKEKRQALIARTVTRGLPPESAKAAGLEMDSDSKCSKEIHPLIGSLPMGWRSLKLRRVATVQGGYAFKSDDFQQEGIPVVRMNSLKRGVLELEGAACIDESECIEAVALRIGDVLYGMSGSVGETGSLGNFAVVRDCDVPCQLNQRVGRFLVRDKELFPDFLVYLIQAPYFYDQILLKATGTAQFNVSGGQIESVLIGLPPLNVQRLMVDYLDARCAEIDALQRKTEQALESLYEFRMAIVTVARCAGAVCAEPAHRNAAGALPPRGPLHYRYRTGGERPTGGYHRAEKPRHAPNLAARHQAISDRPRSACTVVRLQKACAGALRCGPGRSVDDHAAGQGENIFPAIQPGQPSGPDSVRRGQPAACQRLPQRLLLAGDFAAR